MKLDVTCMRYLTKDDYRVLTSIEAGMRNHELVSEPLITSLARLKHGGLPKILSVLLRYKLVAHSNQEYHGYRLSYLGYDILALHTLVSRGTIVSVGGQIGIGKESDIFEAQDNDGNDVVVKIHRLGRTSFRAVRRSRDYTQGRSKCSWLFLSRLAASKEFAFMSALHAHGFPTPQPYDHSRHIVAMSRIKGSPISQIRSGKLTDPQPVFLQCVNILTKFAQHGLIHCDFNEFNLMLAENNQIIVIDFPQMVSIDHPNAEELFERDLNSLVKFFATKMRFIAAVDILPNFSGLLTNNDELSTNFNQFLHNALEASGFTPQDEDSLHLYIGDVVENTTDDTEEMANNIKDNNHSTSHNDADGEDDEGELLVDNGTDTLRDASIVEKDEIHDSERENTYEDSDIFKAANNEANNEVVIDDAAAVSTASSTAFQMSHEKIRDKVQRGMKDSGGQGNFSRNATKKRNKYGKVVRNQNLDC